MTEKFQEQLNFGKGFWANQGLVGSDRIPDSIISGQNVWVEGPGRLRARRGEATTTIGAGIGGSSMMLVGNKVGVLNNGTVILYRGGARFFIGDSGGPVFVDGVSIGTASATLQLALPSQAAVPVGLTAPLAPLISLVDTSPVGTGKNTGSFSVKITAMRTTTGEESNASPASNVVTAKNQQIKITFRDTTTTPPFNVMFPAGADAVNVYVSRRGFGSSGPWFFLRQYSGPPTSVTLDWFDGDTGNDLAPLDFDPPFPGTHCFALGNVVVVAGILGGAGLGPSFPGRLAFPPDLITFLNPAEPILGIRGRAADGWLYVFCKNSLHAVILTGDETAPIIPRAVWPDTGMSNKNAATFVESQLYGYSGRKGAVRTQGDGDPDTTFALPVESIMDSWNPLNVVVGYSPDNNAVVYFHENTALAFKRNLGIWSPPFRITGAGSAGTVQSAVTIDGKLLISINNVLYEFDGNTGTAINSVEWSVIPTWREGNAPEWYKTIYGWRTACDLGTATLTSELFTNLDLTNVKATQTSTGTNARHTRWKKTNAKNVDSYTIGHRGTGGNALIYDTVALGGITKMRI